MMILDSFDDKPKSGGPSNGNGSTGPETSTTSQTNGGGANGDSKLEVCFFFLRETFSHLGFTRPFVNLLHGYLTSIVSGKAC